MSSEGMMVSARGLSKAYTLVAKAGRPSTLAEALRGAFRRRPTEEFWALRDLSLDIRTGEVVGIIGSNGAGKSTLLKILSRITDPTSGQAVVRGRVGSLLEVGTGFHPDLTGRENIYLNGTILGMSRQEIHRRFDAIVAFAEIERFLDEPVKHYSSGMYVRLAFAVAAHLQSDLLLVDEVLAVGDAAFQKKCLEKMGEVSQTGKTVLFVSHNMASIERLCTSVVLLEGGRMVFQGNPSEAVGHYMRGLERAPTEWRLSGPAPPQPHFNVIRVASVSGEGDAIVGATDQLGVRLTFTVPRPTRGLMLAIAVTNELGMPLFSTTPSDDDLPVPDTPGIYRTRVVFPPGIFLAKRFKLICSLYSASEAHHVVDSAVAFDVGSGAAMGASLVGGRIGDLQIRCVWEPIHRGATATGNPSSAAPVAPS